jgi:acetyl esterase
LWKFSLSPIEKFPNFKKKSMKKHLPKFPSWKLLPTLILAMIIASPFAQGAYPPEIQSDRVEIYKTTDDLDLRLWIFNPDNHTGDSQTPAIIFFFGGGWNSGSPEHFVRQSQHLADRGMVAIVADYRVKSRNGVPVVKCVQDAKSAMRWVRKNAEDLGIDPNRIAAGGGSAGGHLAASTAMLPLHDASGDDLSVSCQPNALVLFNPVLVLWHVEGKDFGREEKLRHMPKRLGADPESMSPYHNLRTGLPPAIIFHGTADEIVPYASIELFVHRSKELGNRCELVTYEGADHGFFNVGDYFNDTVQRMDAFLVSLGYIQAAPNASQDGT